MCRILLIDQIFVKSIQFSMNSMKQSSFLWIPTFIYLGKNLNQLLIDSLENKKFDDAFRYSFLLNREKDIDKNWSVIYYKKKENLYCSSCRSPLLIDKAFSATCNHFFALYVVHIY